MEGRAQEDVATSLRLLFTILNSVYVSDYDVNQQNKYFMQRNKLEIIQFPKLPLTVIT